MRQFLSSIAQEAGALALRYSQNRTAVVSQKGRGDYVTQVDKEVEALVVSRIHARFPEHAILGEEAFSDRSLARFPGHAWVIDPIDGTTNFIRGLPNFCVSIGFCEAGLVPVAGAIFDPQRNELFLAERGQGAWLGSERLQTSQHASIKGMLHDASLPFRHLEALADVTKVLLNIQSESDDFRRLGSAALDLAYVAAGRIDAYWELGIHAWDTAAGELMVREAGGVATDFTGNELGLLHRRSIVASASPTLQKAMLEKVAPLVPWLGHPLYRA